jgi:hypothetical protein
MNKKDSIEDGLEIEVIGMACRFPGTNISKNFGIN